LATSRWLTSVSDTVRAALAKARAVASASPSSVSNARLPRAAIAGGHTSGAPGANAATAPTTRGSASHSIAIASAASRAWSSVCATTKATASPTWRTSSRARIG